MPKTTTRARAARKRAVESRQRQRKSPLFTYKKWSIVRFDELNIKLVHENDDPKTNRYYSTLGGALLGLRKEIGFASPDLNAAIDSWDELGTKITAAAL